MQPDYQLCFEIKEVKEDGSFSGIASVYGVEDLGGDIIDKGAFRKTISENPTVPILWQHKNDEVIGEGSVKEWQGKILLEGRLDLEDPTGQKAYGKMKRKLIKGLSIGFQTIKSSWEEIEGRMIRHISELKLWEVSVVTFPMLPDAQVTRVKSAEDAAQLASLNRQIEEMKQQNELLKEQNLALQAKQVATPPEPAQAEEPQQQQSSEPAERHSMLSLKIQASRRGFQWNL